MRVTKYSMGQRLYIVWIAARCGCVCGDGEVASRGRRQSYDRR